MMWEYVAVHAMLGMAQVKCAGYAQQQHTQQIQQAQTDKYKRLTASCRNCGAPPEAIKCSYCGTVRC